MPQKFAAMPADNTRPAAGRADMVWGNIVLDAAHRIESCDRSVATMLGLPAADLIGRHVTELFPELADPRLAVPAGAGDRFAFALVSKARLTARLAGGIPRPVVVSLFESMQSGARSFLLRVRPHASA